MNNPYNILAIDHGNHSIKTPNTMFLTGLRSYGTAPQLAEQYLTYGKRYWVRTGDVPAYTPDKTQTEDLMVYTLFAMHEEAARGNLDLSKPINLAVGLPPKHMGLYKRAYLSYFADRKDVRLIVNGNPGKDITLGKVRVYPQGWAAMMAARMTDLPSEYLSFPSYILVDIGGRTVDVILMRDGLPVADQSSSLEGSILGMEGRMISAITEECGKRMMYRTIEDILLGRPNIYTMPNAPEIAGKIFSIIRHEKRELARQIVNKVNETIPDATSLPWVFEGAGTKMIEEELKKDPNLSPAVEYLTDPHLNAKGYFCVMDRELRGV